MSKLRPSDGGGGSDAVAFEELVRLFKPLEHYDKLYLAVSGGCDSMALMHLVADWKAGETGGTASGASVSVLSVDHGLRPEAREEAAWVVARARERGLAGEVVTIAAEPPESGLQEWARDQRYNALCARVVAGGGAAALVTGHHQGDTAETVLMRLSRGSGVDGLSAMAIETAREGAVIVRPMLGVAKSRLKATLEARGALWIEDPSNASDTFERVRLRKLEAERVALGLADGALALTASRLGRAREALDAITDTMLEVSINRESLERRGLLVLPGRVMGDLPEEIGLRVLMRALVAVGGAQGQLRLSRLERLYEAILKPGFAGATLGNAIVRAGESPVPGLGDHEPVLEIYREPDRGRLPVIESTLEAPCVWDNRFVVSRALPGGGMVKIRALERGDLEMILGPEKASLAPLHEALRATPVIEEADGGLFAPALETEGAGAGGGRYRARFMVERLFSRSSPGGRDFMRVLNIIRTMRV